MGTGSHSMDTERDAASQLLGPYSFHATKRQSPPDSRDERGVRRGAVAQAAGMHAIGRRRHAAQCASEGGVRATTACARARAPMQLTLAPRAVRILYCTVCTQLYTAAIHQISVVN